MGVARLLAKGWIVFSLFAGAHAFRNALASGLPLADAIARLGVPLLLFAAMGLLFIGGYAASGAPGAPLLARFKLRHLVPGFNEGVFAFFVALSFVNQVAIAPQFVSGSAIEAVERALAFAVPGQHALADALGPCGLDGGRIFASAFTWLLAIIYLASSASRLTLAAGIIRLERTLRPDPLGKTVPALVLGAAAIAGIQLLYMGSAYPWLTCSAFTDISGALLIGLAPLALAYLMVAAIANALAMSPE
jgi:hypothetical protein